MSLSLECWGQNWDWQNCENIFIPQVPFKRLTLSPFTSHAIQLNLAPISSHSQSPVVNSDSSSQGEDPITFFSPPSMNVFDENETVQNEFFANEQNSHSDTRVLLTRLTEEETLIVNDINPNQIYRITLAPHKYANASTVFFKINDNETNSWSTVFPKSHARIIDGDLLVRAEEISIVVLILVLWMVAIALFVHRWGKIRMLEPYQPDYKEIQDPNFPLNPSVSPQLIPPTPGFGNPQKLRPPTFKAFPRKSSSLCFTPSMLKTVHIPSNSRFGSPRMDLYSSHSLKGYPSSHSSRFTLQRLRGRFSSECRSIPESDFCRKAKSAENLRHVRINISPGRSIEESEASSSKSEVEKQSRSLENCRVGSASGGRQVGGLHSTGGVVLRGQSLDSYQVLKKSPFYSPSPSPWWTHGMGTSTPYPMQDSTVVSGARCTTPEIRISPIPPETSSRCLHSRPPGLKRQEPLDETLLPMTPYATLHEEENESEEVVLGATACLESESQESRSLKRHSQGSQSQGSQSQGSQQSQESFQEAPAGSSLESQESQHVYISSTLHRFPIQRDRRLTHMSQVTQSNSQESQGSLDGTRDTNV